MPPERQCNLCPGMRAMCTACELTWSNLLVRHARNNDVAITEPIIRSLMPDGTHAWRIQRMIQFASQNEYINADTKTHIFNDCIHMLMTDNRRHNLAAFAARHFCDGHIQSEFVAYVRKGTNLRTYVFCDNGNEMVRKTTKYNIHDKASLVRKLVANAPRGTRLSELIAEYTDAAHDLRKMIEIGNIYKRDSLVWYIKQTRTRFAKVRRNKTYKMRRNMSLGMRRSMRGLKQYR